jgi:RNA polymerase sigma-70 factor, ECF subfamily
MTLEAATEVPQARPVDADLAALRAGDERAFVRLVERYGGPMRRVAATHVESPAIAEEVVQETWIAVLEGIDRFEGRCSLRSWVFQILINRAKTRGVQDSRSMPFSALASDDEAESSVPAERFLQGHSRWSGHWADPPQPFAEDALVSAETLAVIQQAIQALPPAQREVITLRDVHQWSAEEVCDALGLTDGNQRILLHRARSKVRSALERYQREGER